MGCRTQRLFSIFTSLFIILCRRAEKNVMSYERPSRARWPQEEPMLLHSPQYSALYSTPSFTYIWGISGCIYPNNALYSPE